MDDPDWIHELRYDQALAELRRLHAENERLNQCLQYEQHRAERVGTHGPGCHAWGPQHYECAVRLNGELVEALRKIVLEAKVHACHHKLSIDGQKFYDVAEAALARVGVNDEP